MITQIGERLSVFISGHLHSQKTPVAFFTTIPEACETSKFLSNLSDEEQERALRFHFQSDCDNYIVSHAIKRIALAAITGTRPKDVPLRVGPQGKPMLGAVGQISKIEFNLSHTKGLVTFALAVGTPIGVDAERVNLDIETDSLADSCFAIHERHLLDALPEASRQRAFFQIWTMKEAYIKGVGRGLSLPLNSFFVPILGHKSRICESLTGTSLDWITQNWQPTPTHYLSTAIKCPLNRDCDVTVLELPLQMVC